jgi:transglutaminase-like putative cysteine protease
VAGRDSREPLEFLHRLLHAVHERIVFDTCSTHPATSAIQAFALGRGVCQDLSHIFIAAARRCGVPARYVSGHLARADGVVEQEASHAWAEAYVPDLGWLGFDPANGICPTEQHVRVATALDYLGAAPVRGSRSGGGAEHLRVRLSVEREAPRQQQSQS